MSKPSFACLCLSLVTTFSLGAQDLVVSGKLVSKVSTGTPPLQVSSTTKVTSLNADQLDSHDQYYFASFQELLLVAAFLDNPDPACYDDFHRFLSCGNGTVTDSATGLIWLEDADCFGSLTFSGAQAAVAGLASGTCGLDDGSRPGDWRLATMEEWLSILDDDCDDPPKIVGNGTPDPGCHSDVPWATNVRSGGYWTLDGGSSDPTWAVIAVTSNAYISVSLKAPVSGGSVWSWPVRGLLRDGDG